MASRKRLAIIVVALVGIPVMSAQYTMWDRYGVFDWWSAQPEFLKINGRDYERGYDRAPAPHYCVFDTMFPFDYPIAAAVKDGPDGSPCGTRDSTGVYLRWKDGRWTAYGLLGGP
ncbi:hypothetical protein QN239_32060 [Mycolicibacterium sp. Y3]